MNAKKTDWTMAASAALACAALALAAPAAQAAGGGEDGTGTMRVAAQRGEKWWGGTTFYGSDQPYSSVGWRDLAAMSYCNPTAPLFLSSHGRYVWSDRPFAFSFEKGDLIVKAKADAMPKVCQAPERTLRGAYLAASAAHFPPSGEAPDALFFEKPQFNTWVESKLVGNGERMVCEYADAIASNRIPCGVFMVDDGWAPSNRYGDAEFSSALFPHAKEMLAKLRRHGFKTLLWTTPYIARECRFHAEAEKAGLLAVNPKTGRPAGFCYYPDLWTSGLLNLLDRRTWDPIERRYRAFMDEAGFDGYKFDFTDAECVLRQPPGEECSFLPDCASPCDYTGAWGDFARRFRFHELRAGWKFGGKPLVVRLQDKRHRWEDLRLLVPDMVAAGLLGCPFVCPDMIGGGTVSDGFQEGVDRRLFVRSAQVQALMPMMQFSAAPWRVLDAEGLAAVRAAAELHVAFAPEILRLARHAAKTGEPILRAMEYAFPGSGFDECLQQFMLGENWLVAPVVTPDDKVTVRLPKGRWRDDLGEVHVGPKTLELADVPLSRLPRFERLPSAAPIRVSVPEPDAGLGTMPDAPYVVDYYAPPPDAVPALDVAAYTPNVRVPEYHWLKVGGAYALALRIRPIDPAVIEKEIAVGLVDTNRNKSARTFSLAAEKDAKFRRVLVDRLGLDATEFTGVVCRVRSRARNAGSALAVSVSGKGLSASAKPSGGPDAEGFVALSAAFSAKPGATVDRIVFEAPPATDADFEQEFEVVDLRLLRPAPKARFTDLPARRWTRKDRVFGSDAPLAEEDCIPDVYAYARGEGAKDTVAALPGRYELRPQLEKERDGGFEVAFATSVVAGASVPSVRITLRNGPRCLLRFPLAFDGLDYNTLTFSAKVETFPGAKPLLGETRPMLWGTNQIELNRPFDTFQISFLSLTDDFCDWTRWGLAQADYRQNRLAKSAGTTADGWGAFAYDVANSDPSNNKSSFYTKLTHWCFYYDNSKIPSNRTVVVTIADPRLTRGLMLAGGDLPRYKAFLRDRRPDRMVDFAAMEKALKPPRDGRLVKPVRLVEGRRPLGAIYLLGKDRAFPRGTSREAANAYWGIVRDAADEFRDVVQRKFAMNEDIPVLERLPGGRNSVSNSVIVGGDAYAKVDKATYEADMKALAGRPGCAIRSDGTNVYVYAPQFGYAGAARGLAFGLYELLENNTDLIWPYSRRPRQDAPAAQVRRFAPDAGGTFDLVWGDGFVHAPQMPEYSFFNGGVNREPGYRWEGDWAFGRQRTRSLNHWWGYGTEPRGDEKKGQPNDTWGRRADGTLMKPGCYTGHPCLVRVLDRARESFLESSAFAPRGTSERDPFHGVQAPGKAFSWNCFDLHGLWVEDSISLCQCSECLTPIRLADGSTVGPESPYFRSTQFYSNGSAMINAVNVYARRDARVESIGYFWMAPVPLMTVSRSYDVRFCPYIRKNYFVPVYAPMNDMHWRAMYQWAQQDVRLSIYEYFLWVNARPWADVAAFDVAAEAELGLRDWHAETSNWLGPRGSMPFLGMMDRWTMGRLLWGSRGADVAALRGYYLKRTFREAADAVGRFYQRIMSLAAERMAFAAPMEFEDDAIVLRMAMRTPATGGGTVADELEGLVRAAEAAVRDPGAAASVCSLREAWNEYRAAAEAAEAQWRLDAAGGAAAKAVKIVGAPD